MVSREEGARLAWEELYDPVSDEARPSLRDLFLRWVDRLLGELLGAARTALPGGWWTLGALLVVLALLVAALLWYLRPGRAARRAAVLDSAGTLSTDEQRALADECAERGGYAEAMREGLRAVGRDLEEQGVLTPGLGRTAADWA